MRLGILSQWFDPEPGPASLPGRYARGLRDQGHDVRVLTGFPNYPTGRLAPGYRQQWCHREVIDDSAVSRVPLYLSHDRSGVRRAANYASFAISASSLGLGALSGVDAFWVYNSPATVTLPALVHRRFERAPYLLHIQDLWPESLRDSGMLGGGRVSRAIEHLVRRVVRVAESNAASVAVISPSVRHLLIRRGVDPARVVYIPNPGDESLLDVSHLRTFAVPSRDHFTVTYAGSIGDVQDLETAVRAMDLVRGDSRIRLKLVGSGIAEDSLRSLVRRLHLRSVEFTGRVAAGRIPGLLAESDAVLVSLADRESLGMTMPSKIPGILAAGAPVIAALRGDGASVVRDAGAGLAVPPGDALALAEAMTTMASADRAWLQAMSVRGKAYYRAHFSAEVVMRRLSDVMRDVAERRPISSSDSDD